MSGLTPEASRLFRVRKTTVKMLHNRCVLVCLSGLWTLCINCTCC